MLLHSQSAHLRHEHHRRRFRCLVVGLTSSKSSQENSLLGSTGAKAIAEAIRAKKERIWKVFMVLLGSIKVVRSRCKAGNIRTSAMAASPWYVEAADLPTSTSGYYLHIYVILALDEVQRGRADTNLELVAESAVAVM